MSEPTWEPVTRRRFLKGVISTTGVLTGSAGRRIWGAEGVREGRVGGEIREQLDLTGRWHFQADPEREGEKAGYFSREFVAGNWHEVSVPVAFEHCAGGMAGYKGVGWFRRSIEVPEAWRGRRVVLRFEGVNNRATVWVNGKLVGENEDINLPFEISVQEVLRYGGDNLIVVRADNEPRAVELPPIWVWRSEGGFLRKAVLEASDFVYIAETQIATEPDTGRFSLRARVADEGGQGGKARIEVRVANREGKILARFASEALRLEAGKGLEAMVAGVVPGAEPWSPERPVLYQARVDLLREGELIDRAEVRFGFRRIESREGKLLLNGKPIFLLGFNRHEDSPRAGMATDLETVRNDVIEMKQAGANFLRLCHYAHAAEELDIYDEMGVLVLEEIPLEAWAGQKKESVISAAERYLRKMILRDINHPSVIMWSVSNENTDEKLEVEEIRRTLIQLGKELDSTRLVTHVSPQIRWSILEVPGLFQYDDVICVNAYPSWEGRLQGANPSYDFSESARFWEEGIGKLRAAYPDKPIVVTEFGYPALWGINGPMGEDMQARAIEVEFKAIAGTEASGATIWCLADHPWPEHGFGGVGYVITSPFGIMTRDRQHRKNAFTVVKKMYKEKAIHQL